MKAGGFSEDPMLREIALSEMLKKGISKEDCFFGARKRGKDEIAPPEDLFNDFDKAKKRLEKEFGKGSMEAHNEAFQDCNYERRFREYIIRNPSALKKLEQISKESLSKDISLACYERTAKACHRRILLRIAEERFGAEVIIDGVEPKIDEEMDRVRRIQPGTGLLTGLWHRNTPGRGIKSTLQETVRLSG
jgi:hypothetical protein